MATAHARYHLVSLARPWEDGGCRTWLAVNFGHKGACICCCIILVPAALAGSEVFTQEFLCWYRWICLHVLDGRFSRGNVSALVNAGALFFIQKSGSLPLEPCSRVQIVGLSPIRLSTGLVFHATAQHLHLLYLSASFQSRRLLRSGICTDRLLSLPRLLKLNCGFCF